MNNSPRQEEKKRDKRGRKTKRFFSFKWFGLNYKSMFFVFYKTLKKFKNINLIP